MFTHSRRPVALLLALLLALMPLQGLLAAVGQPATAPGAAHASHVDMDAQQMQDADNCQDCDQHECCSQGNCDLQHCLACAMSTALPGHAIALDITSLLPRATFHQTLPDHHIVPSHRPPRA